jgi:hypothetical protein
VAWRFDIAARAPSGRWRIGVTCGKGRQARTGRRSLVVIAPKLGPEGTRSSPLAAPSSARVVAGEAGDGKGGGGICPQPYCETVPGNPFESFGSLGQCTWYGIQRRLDLMRYQQRSPRSPYRVFRGHAKFWYDDAVAAGVPTGSTPVAGALVVWDYESFGHVGYVESVLPDGRIDLSDYNAGNDRRYRRRAVNPRTEFPGFRGYIYGGSVSTPPNGGSGGAGDHMMIINGAGAAYAKDTLAPGGWVQETAAGDASAIAIGNKRQMLINGGGAAYAKDGIGTGGWTRQVNNGDAKSIAVGAGGRMMIINGARAAYTKDTLAPGGWVQETAAGDASAIAVGATGRRMIINGGGAAFAKDAVGAGGWIQQTAVGDALRIAIGGTRQMLINGGGAAYAKDGMSPGGWIQQTAAGDAKAIAVGASGRMMIINACGAAYAKDSLSPGGWIQQTSCGDAKAIAVGRSGRMMIVNACGAAYAKDAVGPGGWIRQTACGDAKAIAVG